MFILHTFCITKTNRRIKLTPQNTMHHYRKTRFFSQSAFPVVVCVSELPITASFRHITAAQKMRSFVISGVQGAG
jgi:hypothetical protein